MTLSLSLASPCLPDELTGAPSHDPKPACSLGRTPTRGYRRLPSQRPREQAGHLAEPDGPGARMQGRDGDWRGQVHCLPPDVHLSVLHHEMGHKTHTAHCPLKTCLLSETADTAGKRSQDGFVILIQQIRNSSFQPKEPSPPEMGGGFCSRWKYIADCLALYMTNDFQGN